MGYILVFLLMLFAVTYLFSVLRRSTAATPEDEARAVSQTNARLTEIDRELDDADSKRRR